MASLSITVTTTTTIPTATRFSSPKALARRNRKPTPRIANPKTKNSRNYKPQRSKYKPPPQPVPGGDASTYSRLPLLLDDGDFASALSLRPLEVKLSDSTPPEKKLDDDILSHRLLEEQQEEAEDEEDYGQYEMFEVGSGSDQEEGEDEYDDEEEDGEMDRGVNYIVGQVFEPGSGEDSEYESEDEGIEDGIDVIMGYRVGRGRKREEEDEVKGEDKEKGLPAVMRCFDRAKIYVKAGDGGNGVVAFRREKFVPFGGPSGGDGGRGGNVYLEVDAAMNSLLPFRNKVHFRAGRGSHGQGMMMDGAKGEDVVVKVAPGTVVREAGKDEVLLELLRPGQRALLLPGGRGGRGNASFKSSGNKVPRIAENGEEGPEMWLELELKLVADVGIVGAPNAGKSTLLSVISAAQPTIANYPFTTLLPNLGVVSFDYDSTMVVADLPGLLEGAHRGCGLGHEFLRHTERCSALVHVVDGSAQQPELEFDAVRLELELFSPQLAEKPYVVAFNKMDLPDACANWPSFKERLQALGIKTFCMSAVKRDGTDDVICAAHELLRKSKEATEAIDGWIDPENLDHVADKVQKQRRIPINDFEISYDDTSKAWHVYGSGLQRFVQMTNWRYVDSEKRFQHVLEACGVNKSLMKMGVKEGDTVIVGEMEMVWHDFPEISGSSNMRSRSIESTKWSEWKL